MPFGTQVTNIRRSGLRTMGKDINILRKLTFDSNDFNVNSTANGIFVSSNAVTTAANVASEEYHFQVEANSNSASTTIDVHGGRWINYYDGLDTGSGNLDVIELTCNSGPSGDYASVKSVNGFSNGITALVVKLDDPTSPTNLTVQKITWYPNSDLFDRTRRVIAKITVTDNVITDIEQTYSGGDITSAITYENDGCSIDRDIADRNQIYQFSNGAATTTISANDQIIIKDADTGCVSRVLWSNCAADAKDKILNDPDFCTAIQTCINNSSDWLCELLNDNCDWTAVDHGELLGLEDDDHNGGHSGGAGNYPYVSGHVDAGSRLGNAFDATAFIADENGNASIYPHGRYLQAAGIDTLSWSGWYLKNGVGNITLNWDTCELANSTWTALGDFVVNSDLDVLGNANVGGEMYVTDFVSADKFIINDRVNNNWDSANFKTNTTSEVLIYSATRVLTGIAGSSQIDIQDEVINLYPSAGGELQIDGTPGISTTITYMKNNTTSGTLTFTKGILTGST